MKADPTLFNTDAALPAVAHHASCTCPIGVERRFCKHTVAISLFHLERERTDAERDLDLLRQALVAIPDASLVDGLLVLARRDPALADELKRLCLDALSRR